jgi:hypothetical protein
MARKLPLILIVDIDRLNARGNMLIDLQLGQRRTIDEKTGNAFFLKTRSELSGISRYT